MNSISTSTWEKANRIYKEILDKFSIQPTRIANSVENGVALVYAKRFGKFKKHYKEFFIEIYGDLTVCYTASVDYQILFQPTEQLAHENFDTYLNNLKEAFDIHFM